MKKKTAAIWLSVVLCAAMLAGCGNAKGDDSGTQTGAAAQAGGDNIQFPGKHGRKQFVRSGCHGKFILVG